MVSEELSNNIIILYGAGKYNKPKKDCLEKQQIRKWESGFY